MKKLKVGILLFNEVEVLDFAGPFEVFSVSTLKNQKPFEVVTISEKADFIRARNGLQVKADFLISDNINLDILIIPGGHGADAIEIHNPVVINWIREMRSKVTILASVCTGSFLLAEAGLLDQIPATTHWMDLDTFQIQYPEVRVKRNIRFVHEGDIVTSAGISAGIDMSFYIMKLMVGMDAVKETARRMEYDLDYKGWESI